MGVRSVSPCADRRARATPAHALADAEFVGIQFRLGTFLPHLPNGGLVDGAVTLPGAARRSFWLKGSAWQAPDFGDADVFVSRLVRAGLLVRGPLVDALLRGEPVDLSLRTTQRRFLRATGLTQGAVRQIEQARRALTLIEGDVAEGVAKLKQSGQNLLIYGSGKLVQSLMRHNLIDEYRLMVYPVVLGSGLRLFADDGEATLELVDTKTTRTGVVVLTYQPAAKAG